MKHISTDFDELIKAKNNQVYSTMLTVKTLDEFLGRPNHHLQETANRDSIASMITVQDQIKKKRVSFDDSVQVRTYSVTQGDHPACGLPLSLDWDYSVSQQKLDDSRVRQSSYEPPRRLSLEDRRQRIYGSVQDNLVDFEQTDNAIDDLLKDVDSLLDYAATPPPSVPELPSFLLYPGNNSNSNDMSCLPRLEDYAPADCPSWDDDDLPSSLASYDELLGDTKPSTKDATATPMIVHWRRIAC